MCIRDRVEEQGDFISELKVLPHQDKSGHSRYEEADPTSQNRNKYRNTICFENSFGELKHHLIRFHRKFGRPQGISTGEYLTFTGKRSDHNQPKGQKADQRDYEGKGIRNNTEKLLIYGFFQILTP